MGTPLVIPTGIENFAYLIEEQLDFVDKSLFIKEVLDDRGTAVMVITRPRRFGKTLNLSMLHHFLAAKVARKSTKNLFNKLKIAECDGDYLQHQGKFPVISLTFKDIKQTNFDDAYIKIYEIIVAAYDEHNYLESSDKLSTNQKYLYEIIINRKADRSQLENSLQVLTECLYTHHGVNPWLLIDEYDTPIQTGYINNYYEAIINFMRGMFSTALKTNSYLKKAVVTGILRIAKESLFSGLNNLKVYSLLSQKYSEYFGFTEFEVNEILKKANLTEKAAEIKQWYNGYQVGNTVIYNPWSIANCIQENGAIKPYWVNTSDNQLIKDLLKKSSLVFKQNFESLLCGEPIEKLIDDNLVFHYLNNNPASVWTLLLMAGYLKPASSRETDQGVFAILEIPNKEVRNLYRQIIEQWLSDGYGVEWYNEFIALLLNGHMEKFKEHLDKIILQITSYHDFAKEPEAFYQGLMLGFTVSLHSTGNYEIKSNRESGLGRFDIMLIPADISKLGIILELKAVKEKESLEEVAKQALHQINENKYIEEMKSRGIKQTLKIGIGFRGKDTALCHEKE